MTHVTDRAGLSEHGTDASGRFAIAVMAKAPRPTKVKTRLVPPLTHDEAMALSASFLSDTTENIRRAAMDAPIHGFVAFAPAGEEALFDGLLAPSTRLVLADGSGDIPPRVRGIGRSLLHAAQALFARGYASVGLLNADSPTLPTELLRAAAAAVAPAGDRIVLGPAEDGGYYLLAMKAAHVHLFEDIRWSTEHVAAETRERAGALGLDVVMLPSWYDVDDPATLVRLLGELAEPPGSESRRLAPYRAPATAGCAARLRLASRFAQHGGGPDAAAHGATP